MLNMCFSQTAKFYLDNVANESKRFHVFVTNRVQQIRNLSRPDQCRHVRGDINPADEVSHGLWRKELLTTSKWISVLNVCGKMRFLQVVKYIFV